MLQRISHVHLSEDQQVPVIRLLVILLLRSVLRGQVCHSNYQNHQARLLNQNVHIEETIDTDIVVHVMILLFHAVQLILMIRSDLAIVVILMVPHMVLLMAAVVLVVLTTRLILW